MRTYPYILEHGTEERGFDSLREMGAYIAQDMPTDTGLPMRYYIENDAGERRPMTDEELAEIASYEAQYSEPGERKRPLGRPPKHPNERAIRTTIALTAADFARLDAIPGASRSDRIRWLLDHAGMSADVAAEVADFKQTIANASAPPD